MASMQRNDVMVMVIIVLSILLLSAVTYIAVSKYKEYKENKDNSLRQEGYQYAVLQLMEQAASCEPVVVFIGNKTASLISIDCFGAQDSSFQEVDVVDSLNKSSLLVPA